MEIVEHFAAADMSSIRNKSGYLKGVMRRFQISGEKEKKRKEERGVMGAPEGAGDEHTDEHTDDTELASFFLDTAATRHYSDMNRQKRMLDSVSYWKDSSVFYKIATAGASLRCLSESQAVPDAVSFCQICCGPCWQGHAQYAAGDNSRIKAAVRAKRQACPHGDSTENTDNVLKKKRKTGGRKPGDSSTRWSEDLKIIQATFDSIAELIPGVTSMSSDSTLTLDALKLPGPWKSWKSMRISTLRRRLIMEMLRTQKPDLHEKVNPLMLAFETLRQEYQKKTKAFSRLSTGKN
jgi:hypothetical protein